MGFATWRRVLAPLAVGLTVVGVVGVSVAASTRSSAAGAPGDSIEIGSAASMTLAQLLTAPGSAQPQYVPPNLDTDVTWVTQSANEQDPTTRLGNMITGRTSFMLDSAIRAGLTRLGTVSCVGGRTANPTSDHPGGRACDLMFNNTTAAGVEAGWRAANWLVANQSVLGVKYVIWQGLSWNTWSRPKLWNQYVSTAYGCPNPANITGCHYDHVHVSMY